MDLIALLPTIFQLSPFSLDSFCLPSNGAVIGGYCAENTICSDRRSLQIASAVLGAKAPETLEIFHFKVPKNI